MFWRYPNWENNNKGIINYLVCASECSKHLTYIISFNSVYMLLRVKETCSSWKENGKWWIWTRFVNFSKSMLLLISQIICWLHSILFSVPLPRWWLGLCSSLHSSLTRKDSINTAEQLSQRSSDCSWSTGVHWQSQDPASFMDLGQYSLEEKDSIKMPIF